MGFRSFRWDSDRVASSGRFRSNLVQARSGEPHPPRATGLSRVPPMRHAIPRIALLAALLGLIGCSHTVRRPLSVEATGITDPLRSPHGVEIHGYATSDGVVHRFMGRARMAGDSLQFRSRDDEPTWDSVARRRDVGPEFGWVSSPPNVVGLRVSQFSFWRTGLLALSPVLFFAGILVFGGARGWE